MATSRKRDVTSDHRYFAGFICFIGVVLFAVAILTAIWPAPAEADATSIKWYLGMSLAYCALGVALLFAGFWTANLSRRFRAFRPLVACLLGVVLIVGAFVILLVAARIATPAPAQATEFAMTVPLSDDQDVQAPVSNAPQAQANSRSAILFWSVPESPPPFRSGLLLMVMASVVITTFGMIYPTIAAGEDTEAKGFVQRMVIPALGFVLFGFGASAQAGADESRENIRLVSRGLPPALSVPREQRSAYILNVGETSAASTRQLQASIDVLTTELRESRLRPGSVSLTQGDRLSLLQQIGNVQAEIRQGATFTDARSAVENRRLQAALAQGFFRSQDAVNQLRQSVESASASSGNLLSQLSSDQRATLCAILRGDEIEAERMRDVAVARMQRSQGRERENILMRTWLEIIGRHPSALRVEEARLRAALGGPERYEDVRRQCLAMVTTSR
jgi:hypothetical protein